MTQLSNRLPVLAAEIRKAHADVQDAAKTAAERAIAAGHALIEAKTLVAHGQWLPWLREHCALAERTAQLYMKVARSGAKSATVAVLGLNAAASAIELEYADHFPCPFSEGTEDERRDWWLYCLFAVERVGFHPHDITEHLYWITRKGFKTPSEWLTDGPAWAASWGGKMHPSLLPTWLQYREENYPGASIEELEARLQKLAEEIPEPKRASVKRRRKRNAA
jgi:hypothetical protein